MIRQLLAWLRRQPDDPSGCTCGEAPAQWPPQLGNTHAWSCPSYDRSDQ